MKKVNKGNKQRGISMNNSIRHPKKEVADLTDAAAKAYAAGSLTQTSTLTVYGIGAERGTWGMFPCLEIKNRPFMYSREDLTWFVDIRNNALKSQGKTSRKTSYYLTQTQEIIPFARQFGILSDLEVAIALVSEHDEVLNLRQEMKNLGKIEEWETRTERFDIVLSNVESRVMEAIVGGLLSDIATTAIIAAHGLEPEAFLTNAFVEGTRGLSLGTDDIKALIKNESILARYKAVA